MSDLIINSTNLEALNGANSSNSANAVATAYQTPLKETEHANGDIFTSIFDASMNMVTETSNYQQEAKDLQLDFASGKTDDILAVTLAQQKAMTALSFTVQVTNKLVDAYKEIMQIQL